MELLRVQRASHTRRAFAENGLLDAAQTQLVVDLDGQFIGAVFYRAVHYGPPVDTVPAYSIGCTLLPEHRGNSYGATVQQLLVQYLFATYAINRIGPTIDIDNDAGRRLASPGTGSCVAACSALAQRATWSST